MVLRINNGFRMLLFCLLAIMLLISKTGKADNNTESNIESASYLSIQSTDTSPGLVITDVTVFPEPIVGTVVVMRLNITSTISSSEADLLIELPDGIQLIAGSLSWHGSLSANQPYTHEISLMVLDDGDWHIAIGANLPTSPVTYIGDMYYFYIVSSISSAQVLSEAEFITQNRIVWPGYENHIPLLPPDNEQSLMPGTPGTITIHGDLSYSAVERDCRPTESCSITVSNQLGRSVVELWDITVFPTGGYWTLLGTVRADDNGFYSITVPNVDPDGSRGIDPALRIYADDAERVHVVDTSDYRYFTVAPGGETPIGTNMPDGVFRYDHHIPATSRVAQALYIFDKLANQGYGFLESEVAWGNSDKLEVNYPGDCDILSDTQNSCYTGQITITAVNGYQPDVILHEYGHFVLSRYWGDPNVILACATVTPPFSHNFVTPLNDTCAWSEGWADFFEMVVQNDPDYFGNTGLLSGEMPSRPITAPGGDPGPYDIWEAVIIAVLWDIYDSPSTTEPFTSFDTMTDGFDGVASHGIWTISTDNTQGDPPRTLAEFYQAWEGMRGADCVVSAIFNHWQLLYAPLSFELSAQVAPANTGTVIADPAPDCPEAKYSEGSSVALSAIPDSGYYFYHWAGDMSGATNPDDLVMDADKTIKAQFGVATLTPTPTATATPTPTRTPTLIPPSVYYLIPATVSHISQIIEPSGSTVSCTVSSNQLSCNGNVAAENSYYDHGAKIVFQPYTGGGTVVGFALTQLSAMGSSLYKTGIC